MENLFKKGQVYTHFFLIKDGKLKSTYPYDDLIENYILLTKGNSFPSSRFITATGIDVKALNEFKNNFVQDHLPLSKFEQENILDLLNTYGLDVACYVFNLWGEDTTWEDLPELVKLANVQIANSKRKFIYE